MDEVPAHNPLLLASALTRALHGRRSRLTVVSVAPAYAGLTLATDAVATTAESDLVRDTICSFFQNVPFPHLTVGLPHSTSYLRISGVPYW